LNAAKNFGIVIGNELVSSNMALPHQATQPCC
jgi:hypothetical protein